MTESLRAVASAREERDSTAEWPVRYARVVTAVDLVIVVVAVTAASIVARDDGGVARGWVLGIPAQIVVATIVATAWMILLRITGSRSARIVGTGGTEFQRVFTSSFVVFGAAGIAAYLTGIGGLRGDLVFAGTVGTASLVAGRWVCRKWLVSRRARGQMSNRVLLVGNAASVDRTAKELARTPQAGLHVVGACTEEGGGIGTLPGTGLPVTGDLDRIPQAIEASGADTVIVTSSNQLSTRAVRELSWQLEPGRQHLIVSPSLTDIGGPRLHTRPVAGLPLIHVETPRYEGGKLFTKRAFDVVAALALLVVLAPVFLILSLAVRFSSRGPVLFKQQRVGLRGNRFHMLKFRSMYVDAEERLAELKAKEQDQDAGNDVMFKMKDDPRVTPIGRVLRRYSLDELPQLINVLTGEMSLVGPRPPVEREVAMYADHVHRRFLVKPGITGLWQVSGRSNLDWDETVRLDLYYVENWTLTGDLLILWKTFRSVVGSDGAY